MNHPISRRLLFLAAGLAVLTSAGCATMRPISSPPPVAKIVLTAPFSVHKGVFSTVVLPAGEYHPLYEDDRFYYYQAPSKVVVNRVGSHMFDGGVYVERGTTTPRGWYFVDQDGSQNYGRFNTPPPTR